MRYSRGDLNFWVFLVKYVEISDSHEGEGHVRELKCGNRTMQTRCGFCACYLVGVVRNEPGHCIYPEEGFPSFGICFYLSNINCSCFDRD